MIYKLFNIKLIGLIGIGLFFLCQPSFSQSQDWMSEYEINALEKMDLTYNKPNKFDEVKGYDFFENNPTLNWLTPGNNQLYSKDNRFIVFSKINNINPISKKKGLLTIILPLILSPKEKERYNAGESYIFHMKRDILKLKGEKAAANWKDYVNFYSKEETVKKFNADKAISYSIKLQPKDYYKGKYNNLWVLFLQKKYRRFKTVEELKSYRKLKEREFSELSEFKHLKGEMTVEEINAIRESKGYKDFKASHDKNLRELNELTQSTGFVRVYCFYKDMPKRKLARYKKKVEKIFRYED